jgi:hypothetical protein
MTRKIATTCMGGKQMHISAGLFIAVALLLQSVSITPVYADDMPKRKSGLWEMKMTSTHGQGGTFTMQQCIDQTTDELMRGQGDSTSMMTPERNRASSKQNCSTQDLRREGNKFVMDSVCQHGKTTATTHAVMTGTFDSSYRMESKTAFDPPLRGVRESTTIVEATWLGPCKEGQRPGDIVMPGMPGGMPNINIQDMMKRK